MYIIEIDFSHFWLHATGSLFWNVGQATLVRPSGLDNLDKDYPKVWTVQSEMTADCFVSATENSTLIYDRVENLLKVFTEPTACFWMIYYLVVWPKKFNKNSKQPWFIILS